MTATQKLAQWLSQEKHTRNAVRFLGIIFIFSAFLKGLDATAFAVQISYFGLVRTPGLVHGVALLLIGVESVLGILLIFNIHLRRLTLPLTFGVLGGFSLLLLWAWLYTDIKDCGCFGKFLRMSPGVSLLKNAFLFGLGLAGWRGSVTWPDPRRSNGLSLMAWTRERQALFPALMIAGIPCLIMALSLISSHPLESRTGETASVVASARRPKDPDRKLAGYKVQWEGKELDLSHGVYFVAMLSDSCEHCSEMVTAINQYGHNPQLPAMVGLVLGEADTYAQFIATFKPRFATTRIPVLEFFDLIGNAPPRFYLVRDGKALQFWDEQIPTSETILQAMKHSDVKPDSK